MSENAKRLFWVDQQEIVQKANARLAWWKEIIPKQQIRINAMLAEANRVSNRYAEVGYWVLIKDRFDEPLG